MSLRPMETHPQAPDRNLAMDLARATEAAALAAGRWFGRGDKNGADGAAVDAMRLVLNSVPMDGVVVIGEGEKDEAPMLFNGEEIGSGGPACDIAVDPIDGTTLTSLGRDNAISVIAMAERGTMFDPGPCVYMDKIVVGPEAVDVDRHRRAGHRQPRGRRQGEGREGQRRHRGDPRPRRATPTSSSSAARPAPGSALDPRRRRRRRDLVRDRPAPARTSCSASAARPKASSPRARSSAWAARSSAGSGPATTRSARAALDARLRPRPGPHHRRPRVGRRGVLRRHRHQQRRPAEGRPLLGRRREHREPRDALEDRDHPQDPGDRTAGRS